MIVDPLVRALLNRGWYVTTAADRNGTVTVGFDLMAGLALPSWLKAFALPLADATPDGFEAAIRAWQGTVLSALQAGKPSPLVRRMIAEHGAEAVNVAMTEGFRNAA